MKINLETRKKMVQDMLVVVDYFKITPEQLEKITIGELHNIWFHAFINRNFNDSNSNVKFINGKRLLKQDKTVEQYPCDSDDNTLTTALKWCLREIINRLKSCKKLVVVNEHTLGYIHPELQKHLQIIHGSIIKGAALGWKHGYSLIVESDIVRLASEKDFDEYNVCFKGFNNENEYIFLK